MKRQIGVSLSVIYKGYTRLLDMFGSRKGISLLCRGFYKEYV